MKHEWIHQKKREISRKRKEDEKGRTAFSYRTASRENAYIKRIFTECSRKDRLSEQSLAPEAGNQYPNTASLPADSLPVASLSADSLPAAFLPAVQRPERQAHSVTRSVVTGYISTQTVCYRFRYGSAYGSFYGSFHGSFYNSFYSSFFSSASFGSFSGSFPVNGSFYGRESSGGLCGYGLDLI